MESISNEGVKLERAEKIKTNLFFHFHQIGRCTRDLFVNTCTRQHNMQGDKSEALIEHLDEETTLMDV